MEIIETLRNGMVFMFSNKNKLFSMHDSVVFPLKITLETFPFWVMALRSTDKCGESSTEQGRGNPK